MTSFPTHRLLATVVLASLSLITIGSAVAADPLDWTYVRGPEFNGISRETGLPDQWDPKGGEDSNVSWKRDDLGGRSTPIVMNGKLYTIVRAEPGSAREGERVVCIDAVTGEDKWESRFNVWLSDVPDTRVGWSSVTGDPETGLIYAQGVCGYFQCLDGETGKTVWSVSLHEKFGLLSTYGGRTNFPIVVDDLVIVSAIVIGWGEMAKPAHRFIAFDKKTGAVVWFRGTRPLPYDTTYSPPTLAVLNGQKALVFGSGDGAVWAIQPRTGKPIWHYKFSMRGLNVSPVVVDDVIYTGHSEENIGTTAMGAVAAIGALGVGDVTKSQEKWKVDQLMVGKASPLVFGGRMYCIDDRAKIRVLDIATGEEIGKRALGTVQRSSPLYADGKIYTVTANGRIWVLKPDDRGVSVVSKGRLPRGDESHASPICSHGRIYIQTTGGLYCLEDKTKEHGVAPRPEPPKEKELTDKKPAHVQLIPGESLVRPGEKINYKVRLFNALGQFLKESDAEYSLTGPGKLTANTFTAEGPGHTASYVTAKVDGLEGRTRVRVVPDFPWKFDFEGLSEPPVSWVGARYRHVIRPVDGNNAMVKITTIPKGTRSRCWFGHPELSNYTISATVKGAIKAEKMPDIGLIAQGYTLDLQGASQKLQIRTWVPQLRMAQTIDFPWKPNVAYSMKFKASVEEREVDGKVQKVALLQGKVWPASDSEPTEWTISAVDESPNLHGSPGLFGSAKDAEIMLDNIEVKPNS